MSKTIFVKTILIVCGVLCLRFGLSFLPEMTIIGYEKPVHISDLIEISDVTVLFTGAFFCNRFNLSRNHVRLQGK